MTILTKFDLGQTVWYVSSDHLRLSLGCKVCNDTKEVTITDQKFECPNCVGRNNNRYRERWFVSGNSKIGQVRVEYTEDGDSYSVDRENDIRQYMLRATGVGSGTLWREDKLFATEHEAQAYCDVRNAEIISKENNYLLVEDKKANV